MHAALKRYVRHGLIWALVVTCIVVTIRLFDWHAVGQALSSMRVGVLLGAGVPLLMGIFIFRGWRWLVVLGIRPTPASLWQSTCANGVAAGLASLTPFQLGEVIKVRLIPNHHGAAWKLAVSAFFVERILDVGSMCCVSLAGLAIRYDHGWAALPALCLPVLGAFVVSRLASMLPLPDRLRPFTEVLLHTRRVLMASALSIPIWMLYGMLWWIALDAMNVPLDPAKVAILLGGVMLTVVASMTPGGLGVSELSSRGLLMWLGQPQAEADVGAIALRLLTPLIAAVGLVFLLPLWKQLRRDVRT